MVNLPSGANRLKAFEFFFKPIVIALSCILYDPSWGYKFELSERKRAIIY
jgi:hypothetical protein